MTATATPTCNATTTNTITNTTTISAGAPRLTMLYFLQASQYKTEQLKLCGSQPQNALVS